MSTQIQVVFENGVFRPLQPVQLAEHRRLTVTIEEKSVDALEGADEAHFVVPEDRWQAFCDALDAPPKEIPALNKLLTTPSLFDGSPNAAS